MKAPSTDLVIKLAVGAGVILGVLYVGKGAAESFAKFMKELADGMNPLNGENAIYKKFNDATGGDENNPLGGRIYDYFHKDPMAEPEKPKNTGAKYDNVIYHTVNTATGGDDRVPLGARIYNFFHKDELK